MISNIFRTFSCQLPRIFSSHKNSHAYIAQTFAIAVMSHEVALSLDSSRHETLQAGRQAANLEPFRKLNSFVLFSGVFVLMMIGMVGIAAGCLVLFVNPYDLIFKFVSAKNQSIVHTAIN